MDDLRRDAVYSALIRLGHYLDRQHARISFYTNEALDAHFIDTYDYCISLNDGDWYHVVCKCFKPTLGFMHYCGHYLNDYNTSKKYFEDIESTPPTGKIARFLWGLSDVLHKTGISIERGVFKVGNVEIKSDFDTITPVFLVDVAEKYAHPLTPLAFTQIRDTFRNMLQNNYARLSVQGSEIVITNGFERYVLVNGRNFQ